MKITPTCPVNGKRTTGGRAITEGNSIVRSLKRLTDDVTSGDFAMACVAMGAAGWVGSGQSPAVVFSLPIRLPCMDIGYYRSLGASTAATCIGPTL